MKPKSAPPESADTLLQRRARILATLPPFECLLRGSFLEREIRCGKATCRCATGPGHPTRYLSVTLPGGRTEQVTVPEKLAATVEQWVRNYTLWWEAIETISSINRTLLRKRQLEDRPAPPNGGVGTAAKRKQTRHRRGAAR